MVPLTLGQNLANVLCHLFYFQIWPPGGRTCVVFLKIIFAIFLEIKFVFLLSMNSVICCKLVQNLFIRWSHFHSKVGNQIVSLALPHRLALLAVSVSTELVYPSARVTSVKFATRYSQFVSDTQTPMDRTPGIPGSDKNIKYQNIDKNIKNIQRSFPIQNKLLQIFCIVNRNVGHEFLEKFAT